MDFRSDFRSYIKKNLIERPLMPQNFFLSAVGSIYGVFSHFTLFIYYDDNDNDENFCLLEMKVSKEIGKIFQFRKNFLSVRQGSKDST